MFSGIIQDIGKLKNFKSNEILINTSLDLSDCKIGSSIACNGVCLTAISIQKLDHNNYNFSAELSEETILKTNFSHNNFSNYINIEKSLKVGDEISGHFVYGHVDCVTEIIKINKLESSWNFEFKINNNNKIMQKFIVKKGSIAINGISLTISETTSKSFSISIVPHTYENTNLKYAKENDLVNVEFDALARYIVNND
tara:strand:- start:38 stop:631 length:594 start_codon:yes stop_codon:yes gene_type:complete